MSKVNPVVLCILDGFGIAPDSEGNAWTQAKTPTFDTLIKRYPSMALRASGEDVGLSWGEMGNSEVGHLAIGSGRVFYQMLPRIDRDIEQQTFFDNPALLGAIEHTKENKSSLHLVGLVSQGLVHSADTHCHALLDLAKRHKVKDVYVHVILDGRDTDKDAGAEFVATLQTKMQEYKVGQIASLSGRFFAMDRNQRWDRIEIAYRTIAMGLSEKTHTDPNVAIRESYKSGVFDEQFVPTVITKKGKPVATVADNDAVIFFNYRPDRARQLTKAFVMPDFDKFKRTYLPNLYFTTMAEYEASLPVEVAFPPNRIGNCLAEVVANSGLSQFHISETEKYAHVTFFMNGTREDPFPGEDRAIIHSPRVASYDETPA
ncbi:MAG: 2,3-bisphosphoglycerate-independent phosphoglycerate mutase, partial [Candidatus Uhrbacteria bacterium]